MQQIAFLIYIVRLKLFLLVYFYCCLLPAANVLRSIHASTWAKLAYAYSCLWIFLKISLYYLFQNLICSECGDEFTLQSQLSIHMEEHRQELAGSRVHSCKSCKKEFETSSQLKEHMKTHYKIRWQSWVCSKMGRCYFYLGKAGIAFPVIEVPWSVEGRFLSFVCCSEMALVFKSLLN